jgi:hypothetical protein
LSAQPGAEKAFEFGNSYRIPGFIEAGECNSDDIRRAREVRRIRPYWRSGVGTDVEGFTTHREHDRHCALKARVRNCAFVHYQDKFAALTETAVVVEQRLN